MQLHYPDSVDAIDLSNWDFWRKSPEEREGAFALLRKERPIAFFEEGETSVPVQGAGYWVLSRHAEVLHASLHPRIFSSAGGITIAELPPEARESFGSMIVMDDPRHKRLRSLVSQAFTPRHLRQVETDVQEAARQVINTIIEQGECDFVDAIAAPFPIQIICDMLGIPESQHAFVFEQTNIILGGIDPEYGTEDLVERFAAVLHAGQSLSPVDGRYAPAAPPLSH